VYLLQDYQFHGLLSLIYLICVLFTLAPEAQGKSTVRAKTRFLG
jgi:hypothetical protein